MNKNVVKAGLMAFLTIGCCLAFGQQPVSVTVNGQPVQFSGTPPQQVNGRVLVPLRGVFEQLGASVHWDQATQSIDAARTGVEIHLQIGNNVARINGQDKNLDVPPMLIADTTMVPLRFVSEALGAEVNWNDAQQSVAIITQNGPGHDEHYGNDDDRRRREHDRDEERRRQDQLAEEARHRDQDRLAEEAHRRDQDRLAEEARRRQQDADAHRRDQRHALHVALHRNEVIPVTLDEPLSSDHNVAGDRFAATLQTDDYAGLPAGTKILGHVAMARPRDGREPGVLQLSFDQVRLPNGAHIDIDGRLIGLDSESVSRQHNGVLVSTGRKGSENPAAFIGYGAGAGAAIGLLSNDGHVVRDAAIGGAIGLLIQGLQGHPDRAQNVYLRAGTTMGVRLGRNLNYGN